MKVIVFGATGFIGSAVAEAFARAGHITYGTSRSSASASELAKNEIVPLICDPITDEGKKVWGPIASTADVVIDCSSIKSAKDALILVDHFKSLISDRPRAAPKPTYIYTGGLWSWTKGAGDLETWSDERQPRSDYNAYVQWRKDVEDPILLEDRFNGVVIRPPMLYGKSGSFVAYFIFNAAYEAAQKGENFTTPAREDTRWQTIHQDDIGKAYRAVAEVGHLFKGQTVLPANPQTERLTDVLDAVVRVSGAKGWSAKEATSGVEKAWVSTLNSHPSLLTAMTSWRPKKLSLVDGMDLYWAAFVASKQEK